MSAVLREVRLLDREPKTKPTAPLEQKRVGEYVIVKGIPIPPRHQTRRKGLVDALKALDVGESFVHRKRINTEAIRQVPGRKFVQRKVGDGPQFRVWRTA